MPCAEVQADALKAYPVHHFHYPAYRQELLIHQLLQKSLSLLVCFVKVITDYVFKILILQTVEGLK